MVISDCVDCSVYDAWSSRIVISMMEILGRYPLAAFAETVDVNTCAFDL